MFLNVLRRASGVVDKETDNVHDLPATLFCTEKEMITFTDALPTPEMMNSTRHRA